VTSFSHLDRAKYAADGVVLVVGLGLLFTDEVVRRLGLPAFLTGKALDTFFGPEDSGDYVDRTSPATPPPSQEL
jgi:hypothetical protein